MDPSIPLGGRGGVGHGGGGRVRGRGRSFGRGFARGFNGQLNFTDVLAQMSVPNDGGRCGGRGGGGGGGGGQCNGHVSGRVGGRVDSGCGVKSSRDRNPRMYPVDSIPVAQGSVTAPHRDEHHLALSVSLSFTIVYLIRMHINFILGNDLHPIY